MLSDSHWISSPSSPSPTIFEHSINPIEALSAARVGIRVDSLNLVVIFFFIKKVQKGQIDETFTPSGCV